MLGLGKKVSRQETITAKASEIIEKVKYPLLRAGWEEYLYIKQRNGTYEALSIEAQLYITPEWFALKKLVEVKGHFDAFGIYDLYLLKSLKEGYVRYDEIMHTLMDHHNDKAEGEHFFAAHPNLHKHIPKEFDNAQQVIKVLVEIINQFRWEIEDFSKQYGKDIDGAIAAIIKSTKK